MVHLIFFTKVISAQISTWDVKLPSMPASSEQRNNMIDMGIYKRQTYTGSLHNVIFGTWKNSH